MFASSAVLREALPLFQAALERPEAEEVRRYLVDARDLRPAFVRSRRIGVYPGARVVNAHLLEQGLSQQAIVQSGILRRDVDGALVVPWTHENGAPGVLVFRRMEAPTLVGEPKSKTRYAALGDRDAMAPDGLKEAAAAGVVRAVVVEGTFDFLQLRQQGELDVVTPHSCALRPAHFARLRKAGVREVAATKTRPVCRSTAGVLVERIRPPIRICQAHSRISGSMRPSPKPERASFSAVGGGTRPGRRFGSLIRRPVARS